jgi:hypothetical protein
VKKRKSTLKEYMGETNETNPSQVEKEPYFEVFVDGEKFVFKRLESGKFFLRSTERYEHMGMPHRARAAAALAKKLGTVVEFDHNGANATVDFSSGKLVYTTDTPAFKPLLDEAFDSNRKEKIKQYVREWMQKDEVRAKFEQIIVELKSVEAAGKYNNLFESPNVATALVEAVKKIKDILKENDPLSRTASLIYELSTDLQDPMDDDWAGFEDDIQALTFVTQEAYRQFKTRDHRN